MGHRTPARQSIRQRRVTLLTGPVFRHATPPERSYAVVARAVEARRRAGVAGGADARTLAAGDGWRVTDLVCTCGVRDPVADETHDTVAIALVLAGGFRYRSTAGGADLSPGAILVGTPGRDYACAHVHGEGDRCLAIQIDPPALDGFLHSRGRGLEHLLGRTCALPTHRATTGLFAEAERLLQANSAIRDHRIRLQAGIGRCFESFAGIVVDAALDAIAGAQPTPRGSGDTTDRRLADLVRAIDAAPHQAPDLTTMAGQVGLSTFHFVRRFRAFTGSTPHAYVRRARIRDAALRLRSDDATVARIALDCGFDDLSTFNAAFRQHLGHTPRAWRLAADANAPVVSD